MTLYVSTFATPFGPFSVAVDDERRLVATAFGDRAALRSRIADTPELTLEPDEARTARVRKQVLEYARGERAQFDLPLAPVGSPFQQRVWSALRAIPPGETRCYGDLALQLGSAPRAVGRANALNPICVVVPCHRVIGKDGTLTGFAFGTKLKQRLLEHEVQFAPAEA